MSCELPIGYYFADWLVL